MTEKDYHSVCARLDDLSVRILELMDEILKERVSSLDSLVENGFVNLAKSKYINGCQSVSIYKVNDTSITPLKKVVREESGSEGESIKFHTFKIVDNESSSSLDDIVTDKTETVRQRIPKKPVDDEVSSKMSRLGVSDEEDSKKPKKQASKNDPLNWFGVLVPQSLRSSQACFKKSLDSIACIASLQNELNSACDKYKCLLKEKKDLAHAVVQ